MIITVDLCNYMDGEMFESFIHEIYSMLGNKVEYTGMVGDQGVDLLLYKENEKIAIQCKKYSSSVGNSAVQQVYAGISYYECDKGIVVTNSRFTKSAKDLARSLNIKLIDGKALESILEVNSQVFEKFYKSQKLTEIMVNLGVEFLNDYQYDKGIILMSQLIKQSFKIEVSKLLLAYNNLGLLYKHNGDYQKAIDTYEEALMIPHHPKNEWEDYQGTILNNLTIAYKQIGEFEKARETLNMIKPVREFDIERVKKLKEELQQLISDNIV